MAHEAILQKIQEKDAIGAQQYMQEHLQVTWQRLQSLLGGELDTTELEKERLMRRREEQQTGKLPTGKILALNSVCKLGKV